MTIDEVEKVIRESMNNCESQNIKVRPGTWGVVNTGLGLGWNNIGDRVCPLGAVLKCGSGEFNSSSIHPVSAIKQALNVSRNWIAAFIKGVDNAHDDYFYAERDEEQGYKLGQKIGKELIAIEDKEVTK